MGTLTSSSFTPLDFRFRLLSVNGVFGKKIRLLERKNCSNLCYLYKERSKKENSRRRSIDKFRCCSGNENDGDDKISKGSNFSTTTTSPDEAEERNDSKTEQTPPSISSRVTFFLSFNLLKVLFGHY